MSADDNWFGTDSNLQNNVFQASNHKNGCGGSLSPPTARSASNEPKAKLFPQGRNRLPFTRYDTRHKASDQAETQFGTKLVVFWSTFTLPQCEPVFSFPENWGNWKNRHIVSSRAILAKLPPLKVAFRLPNSKSPSTPKVSFT